jgi:hypothetical protein
LGPVPSLRTDEARALSWRDVGPRPVVPLRSLGMIAATIGPGGPRLDWGAMGEVLKGERERDLELQLRSHCVPSEPLTPELGDARFIGGSRSAPLVHGMTAAVPG